MADDMAAKICSRFTHVAITAGIVAAMFVKPTVLHIHWSDNDVVFPVLYLAASISSLALYFLVSCMDPGFVKKGDADVKEIKLIVAAENEEEDEDVSLLQKPSNNLQFDEEKEPSSPSKSVAFNLEPSQRCGLCGLEKPMRAKHCRECRRCVRKFDHHCPWIGNCVGERNHRWFWIFIAVEFAMLSWSMYISTTGYVTKGTTREWLVENVMLLIADVVIGVLMMVTFSLLCVHTYLVVSNHTTWEQMSRHRIPYLKSLRESENPFNLGTCRNVYLFCCSLQPRDWSVVYNRSSNHGDDDHPTHALVP